MRLVPSFRSLSTINSAEIAHFSRLSSQWWNPHGEFSFLHSMNPVRVQFIRNKLSEIALDEGNANFNRIKPLQNLRVLDVGCGGGLLSESLVRLGANTLGIDASQSNISIAEHHAACDPQLSERLSYRAAPAESLLQESQRFDVVCSMEVIEHVDNPAQFLATCAELIKPGGHLFLSTISRTPLAYFLTIFLAEKVLKKVSDGTHTYSKYVKPDELVDYFQNYTSSSTSRSWISPHTSMPTRVEAEIRGMFYNPLSSSWMLGPRQLSKPFADITNCNYVFWVRKPTL